VDGTAAEVYVAGASERAAVRERDRWLAGLRQHENYEVRGAAAEFDGGSFTREEVELVVEGATLDEVRELAARRRQAERPAPVVPA
jgi:hypothetical protein